MNPDLEVRSPLSSPLRLPMNLGDPFYLGVVFAMSGSFNCEVFINFIVEEDFLSIAFAALSKAFGKESRYDSMTTGVGVLSLLES